MFLAGCEQAGQDSAADRGPAAAQQAKAELRNAKGETIGNATFTETAAGVAIAVEVSGLTPGPHGIHVHQVGRCDPPEFESAGDHFNPENKQHGAENPRGKHAGDLGNIDVGQDGRGTLNQTTNAVTLGSGENSLLRGQGTSLILHASADDRKTDPAGNSGDKVACGVIEKQ
jgi:Cu-Zn family superoxide dismutase